VQGLAIVLFCDAFSLSRPFFSAVSTGTAQTDAQRARFSDALFSGAFWLTQWSGSGTRKGRSANSGQTQFGIGQRYLAMTHGSCPVALLRRCRTRESDCPARGIGGAPGILDGGLAAVTCATSRSIRRVHSG
jgi:hypothetical protein